MKCDCLNQLSEVAREKNPNETRLLRSKFSNSSFQYLRKSLTEQFKSTISFNLSSALTSAYSLAYCSLFSAYTAAYSFTLALASLAASASAAMARCNWTGRRASLLNLDGSLNFAKKNLCNANYAFLLHNIL